MSDLFLIISGVLLLFADSPILGVISLVVGIVARKKTVNAWAIILGAILLVTGSVIWGVIGIVLGVVDDDK
jgi:hypothetical protein